MPDQVAGGAVTAERYGRLPAGPPYFAGRRRELDGLRADIDRPGLDALGGRPSGACRVLLIAGRPGSGRTALATRLVRSLAGRYPDGTLYTRLTDHRGDPVPAARAAVTLLSALPDALAGRRAVMLLDDAVRAEQVLPLLPAGPGCLVVVTAAGPLPGVPDARPCTLGGLDPEAGIDLLSSALGEIRVTVDPTAARTLTEVCEGNPAALRMIGGWLAARPGTAVNDAVRALRDQLPQTPAPQPVGSHAAPHASTAAPHATPHPGHAAHAAIGTPRGSVPLAGEATPGSVRRMPVPAGPPEGPAMRAFRLVNGTFPAPSARMLRMLALAPGGIADLQVASALAGTSQEAARETLFDLAAHGLVGPDADGYRLPGWLAPHLAVLVRTAERPEEVRLARARMLERSVRLAQSCRATAEYDGGADFEGGAAGDGGDAAEARRRAEDVPRALRFATRADAAGWLRSRCPQLLDAARIAVDDGELDTLARRLIAALVRALDRHDDGSWPETAPAMYTLHGLLLEIAERRELPRDRAAALINLADLDMAAGRIKEAVGRYRTALDSARTADDPTTTGRALEALGGAYLELGDPERSADWFGRALALRQTRGELAEVAAVHGRLGEVYRGHRRFTASLREWRAAAAVHRRLRDTAGYAASLGEAARTQLMAGRPEEALRGGHEALHWARQAADARVEGLVLLVMADTLDHLGDPAGARLQRQAAGRLLPGG